MNLIVITLSGTRNKRVLVKQRPTGVHNRFTCANDLKSENVLMSPKLSTLAVMKKHSQMKLNFTLSDDAEAMDLSG
jgi:hypothetical protein